MLKRRAISTVVANLLIMALVVSAGTSIYAWFSSSYGAYQNQVGAYLSSRSAAVQERFIIEKVWFTDADNDTLYDEVSLYMRNVGEIQITLLDVSVGGLEEHATSPVLPLQLDSGQVTELVVTLTVKVQKGTTVEVAVTTDKGSHLRGYWQAG